ncbi:hypothetical protein A3A39_01510 [Candidatus Kaiserbacteria bacterium RIFCSPLOWO2_01_FULL_54_13]|uniref:TrbC/VIRB2 family protein n=1 Tax=Candidatus Kaiserbacteria bacterium RIFCSPLOWO2_01_FULL_54_13 TaxID=1798512 RepID=A0A1F6F3W0_9BACT|nr:MAG: hypothetical protein A3A39_01510 [Candidatus Kaiserbacteria bacterium RIFCSPLOWO2_01_FULL_54_13]
MTKTHRIAQRILLSVAFLSTILFASDAFAQGALQNPLNSSFSTIPTFIAGALKALALIALPIITLFLVISGFLFVTAQGNEQKLATAKKNFLYVIIGALLILGAWIIATLIAGTINQLTGR